MTGFGSGSGMLSFGTPGDSALKESATQATSVYFADKHQEINLPPKFVKQMAKLEKERIKLFEKEKVKVNKLLNSALKVTNSAMKSSSSGTTSTNHIKNQNSNSNFDQLRNEDYEYDNVNMYDNERKSYLNDDDRSVKLAAALCLDREGDRDIGGKSREKDRGKEKNRGREKGRDRDDDNEEKNILLTAKNVPQLDNQYESTFNDEKKNKRLGKLGKITKSVRAYGSGDDNAPQASTSSSTSVGERMIGATTSARNDVHTSSVPTSTSTSTSTSTPIIVNLSDMRSVASNQDNNNKNNSKNSLDIPSHIHTGTGTPGCSQNTPPESQMAMLMCAMGSHLGTLGAEIPVQDVEPVRVPNKVGRPKLSYKEKVMNHVLRYVHTYMH